MKLAELRDKALSDLKESERVRGEYRKHLEEVVATIRGASFSSSPEIFWFDGEHGVWDHTHDTIIREDRELEEVFRFLAEDDHAEVAAAAMEKGLVDTIVLLGLGDSDVVIHVPHELERPFRVGWYTPALKIETEAPNLDMLRKALLDADAGTTL